MADEYELIVGDMQRGAVQTPAHIEAWHGDGLRVYVNVGKVASSPVTYMEKEYIQGITPLSFETDAEGRALDEATKQALREINYMLNGHDWSTSIECARLVCIPYSRP